MRPIALTGDPLHVVMIQQRSSRQHVHTARGSSRGAMFFYFCFFVVRVFAATGYMSIIQYRFAYCCLINYYHAKQINGS
jgi:hypothetical protein